uniref:Uncharacterized protein n=1 Tax=Anguilla anguilla TaxID=7936 RepID=A0A0E9QJ46_ANGAN
MVLCISIHLPGGSWAVYAPFIAVVGLWISRRSLC